MSAPGTGHNEGRAREDVTAEGSAHNTVGGDGYDMAGGNEIDVVGGYRLDVVESDKYDVAVINGTPITSLEECM